jgi:hypothetical protein
VLNFYSMAKKTKTGALSGALAGATAMLITTTADLKSGQPHHQAMTLPPPLAAALEHIVEESIPYTAPQNAAARENPPSEASLPPRGRPQRKFLQAAVRKRPVVAHLVSLQGREASLYPDA